MDKRIEELEMQQTQRGFNQGYLLAKLRPELYATIQKGIEKDTPNHYLSGFTQGGKQYELEKQRELKKAQEKSKTPDKSAPSKQPPKTPTKGR